jgi:pimeloyl-ACP methyl ester carboxylesterase
MKDFKFRDYSVKYIDEGSGEPMVFLHNGGNDHQIWGRQIEHFKKTNRVLALDYLGFGESDKPRIELTLPLYSEMVGEFVDQLKLAPVTLVGNCMGSAMSFDYTLHHPENVKRLILFNIASEKHLLAGPLGKVYQTFSRSHLLRRIAALKVDIFGISRKETDKLLRSQYGKEWLDDPEFADHIYHLYNKKGQQGSLYVALSNFNTFNSADNFVLPPNFPPVCVIWGRDNFILPLSAGEDFCRRLNPNRAEIIDGCGHLPMREKYQEVNRLMESFIEETQQSESAAATV